MTDVMNEVAGTDKPVDAPPKEQSEDLFGLLVGEGKKYKNADELAKSRIAADDHIHTIERENAELKAERERLQEAANTKIALSDVLEELKKANSEPTGEPPVISEEDIRNLVKGTLTEERKADIANTNRDRVNQAVLERNANDPAKAKEFVNERAKELALTPKMAKELSETSPQAFLTLFGLSDSAPAPQAQVPQQQQSTEARETVVPANQRDQSYYTKLQREMGTTKFWGNKQLVQEMYKNAELMGEQFYE